MWFGHRTERPADAIDLDSLAAIDTHVHVESDGHGHLSLDEELMDASAKYFKADHNRTPTLAAIADYYRERALGGGRVHRRRARRHRASGAVERGRSSAQAAEHDDVLIPFASVDPHDGPSAVSLLRDLAAAGAAG